MRTQVPDVLRDQDGVVYRIEVEEDGSWEFALRDGASWGGGILIPVVINHPESRVLEIVEGNGKIKDAISGINAQEALSYLLVTARKLKRNGEEDVVLKMILGNLLLYFSEDKSKLADINMRTLGDLEEHVSRTEGLGRSQFWKCSAIVKKIPNLDTGTYRKIGIEKLNEVARFFPHCSEGQQQRLIEAASTMTRESLKAHISTEMGLSSTGQLTGAVLEICGDKDQIDFIKSYCESLNVRQHVGANSYAEVIIAMIGEVSSSGWPAE